MRTLYRGKMASDDEKKKPMRFRDLAEEVRECNRTQAAAFRELAHDLRRAELAGDWDPVGKVRAQLAEMAIGLEALAAPIE